MLVQMQKNALIKLSQLVELLDTKTELCFYLSNGGESDGDGGDEK